MSLSKIGKISSAIKAINGVSTRGDIIDLGMALKSAGNAATGVSWISRYGKQLDSGVAYQALVQAFGKENITEEMMSKIGYTGNTAGKVGDVAASAGILGSLKAAGAGLATVLKPLLPVFAGVAAVFAAYQGFKALDNQFDLTKGTTTKKYETAKEKHQEAQADLETAQSKYDSNQERIYELRAQENRSLAESQELSNLQDQNELLGAQVSLKERLVNTAKIAEADAAQKDLNKKNLYSLY